MSGWSKFRDKITKPFKKLGRGVEKLVSNVGDGVEDFAKAVGKTVKSIAKEVYKPISIVNPLLGAGLGAIGEGSDGFKSALKTGLMSNILMGKNLANLSASGRSAGVQELLKKTVDKPDKVLENVLKNGGDIEKGLLDTAMEVGNVPDVLISAIRKDFGGVNLDDLVEGVDLRDPTKIIALYDYFKNEPPKLPTVPELELIASDEVLERIGMFKEELDTATQERLDIVQQRMSSRGIRGSMVEEQEKPLYESRDQALAKYELELKQRMREYNNAAKAERFAMETQNYELELKAQRDKADALANVLGTKMSNGERDTGVVESVLDSLGILKRKKDTGKPSVDVGGVELDLDDIGIFDDDYTPDISGPIYKQERPSLLDLGTNSDSTSIFDGEYDPFERF